jgi:hypothetical protein
MDHVGPAILLAQSVVDGACVEHHGSAIAYRIGGLQECIRGKIGDDEANVAVGQRNGRFGRVVTILEPNLFQGEALIEELAGGIVVLDRKPGTGDAIVLGRLLDKRQCRLDSGAVEIADADLDRIGRARGGRQRAETDYADKQPKHHSFPAFLFASIDDRGPSGLKHGRTVLRLTLKFRVALPWMQAITIMRVAALVALMLLLPVSAHAEAPKAAVFDFELLDTSLQGEMDGPRGDEAQRLIRTTEQIRKGLADSGKFAILDIAPVNDAAHAANLQACGGCDVDLAQKLGADLAITGVVQKVSNLILSLNIYLRDTRSGRLVISMSADFRGNTDESWQRTASYLLRNRLLAPNYGTPQ